MRQADNNQMSMRLGDWEVKNLQWKNVQLEWRLGW